MEKVEVNLMGGQPDGHTITVLEGDALTPREPEVVKITGDIRSVSSFVKARRTSGHYYQVINPDQAIIVVNKEGGTITLQTDPNNYYGTTIMGKLELSEALQAFRINEKKTMTQKEVIDILKFNKIHFDNYERQAELLAAYQKFSFTANTEGASSSDSRGNKSNSFSKNVTTKLPDDFILKVPIFKGEDSRTFRVEICLDVTDGGPRFWFESVELHELIEIEKEIIFQRELKECEGLVVIYK